MSSGGGLVEYSIVTNNLSKKFGSFTAVDSIKGEFSSNGFNNQLKHERGVLSMARTAQPDSAGSQFFIMVAKSPHLDGQYASFGKVIEGMEEVDRIVGVKRNRMDRPLEDQKMLKVRVDTFGVDYPEPVKA
jgi:peptidyl-prolyl cis-trans isomerase B (cyclophilin B)